MDAPTTYIVNTLAQHFGFDPKEAILKIAKAMAPKHESNSESKSEEKAVKTGTEKVAPASAPALSLAPEIKNPVMEKKAKREAKKAMAKPAPLLKPAFPLPWCNSVLADRCAAITKNYGLYTQCMSAPGKDGKFCSKCAKTLTENGPALGLAADRIDSPHWEAHDGKSPLRYIQVWNSKKELMKAGVTRARVEEEAAKFGFKIPASEWTKPERRSRRRKLKSPIAESSDSESEQPEPKQPEPKQPEPKQPEPKQPEPKQPVDLVAKSLAQELIENPYDVETDEEDDDMDAPQLCLFPKSVDMGNGVLTASHKSTNTTQ